MVAATPSPPPPLVSFADRLHGWKAAGPGVEATNDGGNHWRVVFRWREPDGGSDVTSLLRTSTAAGLVTFDYEKSFVTSDGGAHWYVVSGLPNEQPVGDQLVGRGPVLVGSRGSVLYQAVRWPLTGLRCGGRWYRVVESAIGDFGVQPRNICLGGPGATIHTTVLVDEPPDPVTGYVRALRVRALTPAGVAYDVVDPSNAVVASRVQPVITLAESWADRDHGWRAAAGGLEATGDGGQHWRLVLRTERTSGAGVDGLIRTSAATGLVGVSGRLFVTNDAGRHWYEAEGGPSAPAFGRGSLLLGTGATTIDRAVQWPLRRLRCTGRWVHSAEYFNLLTPGPRPRTICVQDGGPVVIRMKTVYRLPPNDGGWVLLGRSLVHGTLTADVVDETSEQWQFIGTVVYRDGHATFSPAPTPR